MKFTASEIAAATNGTVADEFADVSADGATQDSREVTGGELFVPLLADRDGHDFIATAVASGAAAYLCDRELPNGGAAIRVADTTEALRDLGRAARVRIAGPVVGITGSVGKTSTKDLLASVLTRKHPTHASTKSFNNEIGVPLTLINAPDDTHAAVVEMGARGIGHIELLCGIAAPTVGVVTTVAAAHTSEFGTVENIALAKGELIEALPDSGLAVLNGDNPLVEAMRSRTSASVLTFGTEPANNVRVTSIELDDQLRATFMIESDWGTVTARPTTRGAHMAPNVAAAVATGLWLGVEPESIEEGLAASEPSPWRMDVRTAQSGAVIINDSYNANPTSVRGAIASLAALPHQRKVAVLGYMAELGEDEAEAHLEIAGEVVGAGIELVAVGTDLYGAPTAGDPVQFLSDIGADTAVLVKGSRSAGLEVVAEALVRQ